MIRRQQVQLRAGEQTTAFISTTDLAQKLSEMAEAETAKSKTGTNPDGAVERYHLARREAFLAALQVVLPA